MDSLEIDSNDFEFFVYPFAEKEVTIVPVLPKNTIDYFGFKLANDELYQRTYFKVVVPKSCAANIFRTHKGTRKKLHKACITHIDGNPDFVTPCDVRILQDLYQKHLKENQGVSEELSFPITFTLESKLTGKKLKRTIDDYHSLTPGTTKNIKSKPMPNIMSNVDDGTTCNHVGTKIYNVFSGVE